MLLTNSTYGDLTALFLTAVICAVSYIKWSLNYWEKRNVPSVKSFLLSKETVLCERQSKLYKSFKAQGERFFGANFLTKPVFFPIDPDIVKHIMSTHFSQFHERGVYYNKSVDTITNHLFHAGGQYWKRLRTKLTPTFTSGKMKMMFQALVRCSDPMVEKLDKLSARQEPVDIKETLSCFTTDVIGSCAFGLDCNSSQDVSSDFYSYGKIVFRSDKFHRAKNLLLMLFPKVGKMFGMSTMHKPASQFYKRIVKDTLNYRETNNYRRNDFMQMMLELKNKEVKENDLPWTLEEIAAQCFLFFVAGFETSASVMTFVLYELAQHQDIQDKVRAEIDLGLQSTDGTLTYESIMGMKYMQQVIDESMRLYPPGHTLTRKCTEDYHIPNTDVTIEKGTIIFLPVLSIHRDEEYYPEPLKFDPERFTDEKKSERHTFHYLPFGGGPRICIGLRFGMMQAKVGLAILLKNYKITLSSKTKPLVLDPGSFITAAKDTIYLNLEKIQQ